MQYGEQISKLLESVEQVMWKHEFAIGDKPNFTIEGFRSAVKIFTSFLMDRLYDEQDFDDMDFENREKMAERAGQDIRRLVFTYTGIDTHTLYKPEGEENQ